MRSSTFVSLCLIGLVAAATPAAANPPDPEGMAKPAMPSPQPRNFADELTDFGIPPQSNLEPDFASPTPMSIPGGRVVRTAEVAAQVRERGMVFIDVLLGAPHRTIPGAIQLPGAGSAGTFVDAEIMQKLGTILAARTNNNPDAPVVFFCYGAECWESYNAALRAMRLGYRNVLWYRGGLAAWKAAGLPTAAPRAYSDAAVKFQ